jgi:type IV pilus assembly protein PilA
MNASPRRARGFTLIELMIVVAIIGLLSSVALPVYKRATLRTRVAERATILQAMRTGIEDAYSRNQIPAPPGIAGAPNPAGAVGIEKRPFQNSIPGWREINLMVQGNCYYTYEFSAAEAAGNTLATYAMSAVGDLDGDGVQSTKQYVLQRGSGHWGVTFEYPNPGEEDDASPDRTF